MSEYCMQAEEIDKSFQRVSFAGQKLRSLNAIVLASCFRQAGISHFSFSKSNFAMLFREKTRERK